MKNMSCSRNLHFMKLNSCWTAALFAQRQLHFCLLISMFTAFSKASSYFHSYGSSTIIVKCAMYNTMLGIQL